MENEGKISLGTAICIFIIILLIAILIGVVCYYNKNDEKSGGTYNTKVNANTVQANSDKRLDEKIDIDSKSEGIESKEFIKNAYLNKASHEIAFRYSNTQSDEMSEDIIWDEVEVIFDNKVIKTFYDIYRPGKEKQEPEIKTILGKDNKEYCIIEITTYGMSGETIYFTFVDDKGEILGIVDYYGGTSINYNGKELKYEINKDNMKLYKGTSLSQSLSQSNVVAIEYDIGVYQNELFITPNRIYSDKEVVIAGSKE